MKFIRYPIKALRQKPSVVTIGNFDGVHLGHQALISQVTNYANKYNLQSVVVSMQPLVAEYFTGKNSIALLTPFKCKYQQIKKLDVDILCLLNFNKKLANYSAEQFMQNILVDGLNAKHIIVGDDFRFGKNRSGDIKTLKEYCQPLDISISHIDSVVCNNDRIASSKIRQLLSDDDLMTAKAYLGRYYSIVGKVVKGLQLGRKLGFPTINIKLGKSKVSINGIYCVKVKFNNNKLYIGSASVGTRPTVNGVGNILEVHILDFNKDVYGQNVEVLFYHKLRNEVKFDSLEELKRHIKEDVIKTRLYFDNKT